MKSPFGYLFMIWNDKPPVRVHSLSKNNVTPFLPILFISMFV